jgi:PAS domain S-box-containing protein
MFNADLTAKAPIFAFGEPYMMLFTAEPQWLSSNPKPFAWITLGFGLVLSLLLAYIVGVLINRPFRLEKKVAQRTQELAESKARYDVAIAAAEMGVWERDIVKGRCIWNDRMLEIFNIRKEDFDGDKAEWAKFIHPDDHNRFTRELTAAERGEKDFNPEVRIIRTDGEVRHIRIYGKLVLGADRKPLCMIGVVLDITGHKQVQQALEESRHMLCVIIDTLPERVWWKDLESRFLGCNIHVARDAGLEHPDQLIGKTDFDMCWAVHAEAFQANDREVMESGQPRLHDPELQVMEDGSTRWIEVSMIPLKDTKGKVFGVLGTYADVTDRKRAEESLIRLSTAIEQSPEAIVITDNKGDIQYINPAFENNTGYTADEALGENPRILKSGEHPPPFYEDMWEIISSGEVWEGRITNKRKNGTLYTEEVTISPVRNVDGDIVNYVAVKRDISRELVQEEELRQAQKMEAIGELAGGVAHDFNNILQGIIGFSELLRYSLDDTSQEYRNADEIHKSANQAAKLTQQLLTFSRKQAVRLEEIDINNVVYDSEALLNVLLGDTYELVLDLSEELPSVNADQGQLTQIIMNLAVNARDAMPEGGRLSISTDCIQIREDDAPYITGARPGSYLCLAVTDTGSGMNEQTKSRIFDPFFTTKDIGSGTGLGLAVIYGIVQQNNGWINVYSEIGKGTCFKVYLPAAESNMKNDAAQAIEGEAKNVRILLIEDDPSIQKMVKKILGKADFTIIAAGSAEDGLLLFDQSPDGFDLLMSDMELPGMRGDELAEALRKKNPDLPVLLFSGYRDQVNRWKHLADKGYAFMNKPFTITILLDTVQNILKGNKGIHG